jgi:Zn-dependent protease
MDFQEIAYTASIWVIPVLLAVTLHEAAHGWVAWRLGDDTAYRLGRVTLNPFRHVDPFGTVVMPALLLFASGGKLMFGYAKPVPVNFWRLSRRNVVLVAAAGPATNFLLALASAGLMHGLDLLPRDVQHWVGLNLFNMVLINVLLGVFNMFPLPPLDGGRVAVGLLPRALAAPLARLERAGMVIILGAVFILPWIGGKLGIDLNVFWWLVGRPSQALMRAIFTVTGLG